MKIADYFRRGIEEGDWVAVCDVFTKLTGEEISPPAPPEPEPEPIPSLADLDMDGEVNVSLEELASAMGMSPADSDNEEEGDSGTPKDILDTQPEPTNTCIAPSRKERDEQDSTNSDDSEGGKRCRKVQLGTLKRPKPFKDDLKIATAELKSKDKKLAAMYSEPKEHSPRPQSLVHVECSVCGKEEDVVGALAMKYRPPEDKDSVNTYKCNKCLTSRAPNKRER